jgi:hypothetical protein
MLVTFSQDLSAQVEERERDVLECELLPGNLERRMVCLLVRRAVRRSQALAHAGEVSVVAGIIVSLNHIAKQ